MTIDEAGSGPWTVDPEILAALRLQKAEEALAQDDPDTALIEAEEYLEARPGDVDALRIAGRAALRIGDSGMALLALEQVGQVGERSLEDLVLLARATFETADVDATCAMATAALERNSRSDEAWYWLGVGRERLGDDAGAANAYSQAEALAPGQHPMPTTLPEATWSKALERARRTLPGPIRAFYSDVPILFEEFPEIAQLRASDPPLSPFVDALYEGTPPLEGDPWVERPESVRLYRGNLGRPLPDLGELARRIGQALLQEAIDWIGITDQEPWGRL